MTCRYEKAAQASGKEVDRMVRSMIAGVAGLKTHQAKLDVIGNNIANVNTWGFKSYSFNFQDSMYSTSINSTAGDTMGGGAGGRNASQVGYGVTTGSISTEFGTGAPAPSSNPLDCMIDGTGFFLVGNMVNGAFTDVADSGLYLSRVGIFRVDGNGYLVDDQKNYVYGYALVDDTGIPEKPATSSTYTVTDADVTVNDGVTPNEITIGGITITTTSTTLKDQIQDWIAGATKSAGTDPNGEGALKDFTVSMTNYDETNNTVNLMITAKQKGDSTAIDNTITGANWGAGNVTQTVIGTNRVPGVDAEFETDLSAIRIPTDPDTGQRYDIRSYKINDDGTIVGTDADGRAISIGQIAIVSVENPNGLEKTTGYYYTIGPNAGTATAGKANGGSSGSILGNYLEMANVDLANEFTQMITTQRGYQANSKIITVTDQMLEELVNMKR